MKEIRVGLYSGENDNYVELWKTVEKIEGNKLTVKKVDKERE